MFNIKLLIIFVIISNYSISSLISSNKKIVNGTIEYVCALFRPKNLIIDDICMPELLTFCSGTVISTRWVLTAFRCYVQKEWYVTPITVPFTSKLPNKLHTIQKVYDKDALTLIRVTPELDTEPVKLPRNILNQTSLCKLYGFSTPDDKPIYGNNDRMLYRVWHMEGHLLEANVEAMYFEQCIKKHPNGLNEFKRNISESTLCLNAIRNEILEPCAFDRGAPIVCDDQLQGVLIYQRSLPANTPLHLPVGCYGNINTSLSIYAEAITPEYLKWIHRTFEFFVQN